MVGRDEGGRVRRELYSTYDIDTVSSRQWSRVQIEFNSTDGVAMVAPRLISGQNRLSLHIKVHGQNCSDLRRIGSDSLSDNRPIS